MGFPNGLVEKQLYRRLPAGLRLALLAVVCESGFAAAQEIGEAQNKAESKVADVAERENRERLELKIEKLILQLGAESYSQRLEAQSELERIGVVALDQLHQASFHSDPHIASVARFMVQSNQFSWAWDTDTFPVRNILNIYSSAPLHEKSAQIDRLNLQDNGEGLAALCRIVRYETQGCLAKKAALLVMRSKPLDGESLDDRKKVIAELIDGARSVSGNWVTQYVQNNDTDLLSTWKQLIDQETKLLNARSSDTSLEIVVDLKQWVAEQFAKKAELKNEALELARSIVSMTKTTGNSGQNKAIELAQWAIEFSFPEIVQEQHDKLETYVVSNPLLGYMLAESYLIQNDPERAKQIATYTSKRIALDGKGRLRDKSIAGNDDALQKSLETLMSQRNATLAFDHLGAGMFLEQRGRFDWAETEYRLGIHEQMVGFSTQRILVRLSSMLHDQQRDDEAVKVLDPFLKRYNNEPMFRSQAVAESGDSESLVSNYHYYSGEAAAKRKEYDSARGHYLQAIDIQYENVDALIGLFRIPSEAHESDEVQSKYKEIVARLKSKIESHQQSLRHSIPRTQATDQIELANELNTLAWLVCNTDGNLEDALFLSRKACAMTQDKQSAYLDTLARCYARLGRYQEAIRYQRKALALEPHSLSMNRSMLEYETQLKEHPSEEGSNEPTTK